MSALASLELSELSLAERIARQPPDVRQRFYDELTEEEAELLQYEWRDFWARPKQVIPSGDDWHTWVIMAGRGWGKTRTGAEAIRELISHHGYRWLSLVGRTAADVRDVMIEGPTGLLSVFPPHQKPNYEPSKRRITFHNGAVGTTFSADEPDQMRGPQSDLVWGDELAAWRYSDAFDQLSFGNRLGTRPLKIFTTTPRPTALMKSLVADSGVRVTKGTTFENARNLAKAALDYLLKRYQGTRLGRQELEAILLTDVPGALWQLALIDLYRVAQKPPPMKRIVVAIDPATTATEDSSETGIIVSGLGRDGHGYVLEDCTLKGTPSEWARQAIAAYYKYEADRIIAETNNGGDMVEAVIRAEDKTVSFKQVKASRGKQTRAEPVSALYEQGRVHHIGAFSELEDQMTTWLPGETSPDRMDALVWSLTELMLGEPKNTPRVIGYSGLSSRTGKNRR